MAQQTAVDYLIEQLQAPCRGIPSHIIEQAKAMEKEQINDACYEGYYQEGIYDTRAYYDKKYKLKIYFVKICKKCQSKKKEN